MKIGFQMHAMEKTVPGEEHTLALMEEARRRGYAGYHFEPGSVSLCEDGTIKAMVAPVEVDCTAQPHYTLGAYEQMDLAELDVIFFRQDPPFDMAYVTNTYLLQRLEDQVLFVNNPRWIREMPDKLSIFDYPEYLPPTLVSRESPDIEAFFAAHKDVVIKPLYGFHGHGIERTSEVAVALKAAEMSDVPIMFQPFLPEIAEGNKRIVLYDGEIVGALKTVPSDEEFRIYRDSVDVAYEPSAEEIALCAKMAPVLKERGLIFVGLDLIGPYLTEINVGSVGSLLRLNAVYGGSYEGKLFDVIEAKITQRAH
jgi:glutathione synthase